MVTKAVVREISVIFLALILILSIFVIQDSHFVVADSVCEETELSFDDDQLDSGWLCGGKYCGGIVSFTPPTTPWVISKAKVMAWIELGDAPFWIEIWDSDRNELFHGEYMYSDYFTSYSAWVEIEMPYIVVHGDFYVGFFGNWSESHQLRLGFDDDEPVDYHSFVGDCDVNSILYGNEWDWMIRAVGCSPPTEVWVDDDFTPDTPGWGVTHFDKIQDGIDAVTGSTVHVAAGTYYENITLKDGVQLLGAGADVTIIDGGNIGSVVTAIGVGPETVLDGFTITSGNTSDGGGIYCNSASPIIGNNRIINNHADGRGGGIYCGNSSNAEILDNIIQDNSAYDSGGGIFFNFSSPRIDGNIIISNAGGLEGDGGQGGGIAGYGDSDAIISNNLIINNSAVMLKPGIFEVGGGGIALDNNANAIIINNIIDGNCTLYGYGGGIFCDYNTSPVIMNNIITNSPDGEGIWVSSVGTNPTIDYNNIWNNTDGNYGGLAKAGANDISADPVFGDPASGDYHLLPSSPCIDAGTNVGAPTEDIEGNPRPIDGDEDNTAITDIGAYEYVPPPIIAATIDFDPDTLNLKSKGKWITVYIELPEGYDVKDIDISTLMLNGLVPAWAHPTDVNDYDSDGVPDLMVKFDRSDVQDVLEAGDGVEVTVSGELTDGTTFEGTDTIRVIDKGKK